MEQSEENQNDKLKKDSLEQSKENQNKISQEIYEASAPSYMIYFASLISDDNGFFKQRELIHIFDQAYSQLREINCDETTRLFAKEVFEICYHTGCIKGTPLRPGLLIITPEGRKEALSLRISRSSLILYDLQAVRKAQANYYPQQNAYGGGFNAQSFVETRQSSVLVLGLGEEMERFSTLPGYLVNKKQYYSDVFVFVHQMNPSIKSDIDEKIEMLGISRNVTKYTLNYYKKEDILNFLTSKLFVIQPSQIDVALSGLNRGMIYQLLAFLSQYKTPKTGLESYMMPCNTSVKVNCFYNIPKDYVHNPGEFDVLHEYSFRKNKNYNSGLIFAEENALERMRAYAQIECKRLLVCQPIIKPDFNTTKHARENAELLAKEFNHVKVLDGIDMTNASSIRHLLNRFDYGIDFIGLGGTRVATALSAEKALCRSTTQRKCDIYYAKLRYRSNKFSVGSKEVLEFELKLPSLGRIDRFEGRKK